MNGRMGLVPGSLWAGAVALLLGIAAQAEPLFALNGLFTGNMVLQRGQPVPVWGTAAPGEKITVEFAGQKKSAVAGDTGEWQLTLDPMAASSNPGKLLVRSSIGNQQATFGNVLVGDVWLCAGQSNMAQTMKRYLIWDKVQADFSNDRVRLFKIKESGVGRPEPATALVVDPAFTNSWQCCTAEFAAEFSATAGFFGLKLQRDTGVPIGLLSASRGATQAASWLPREVLEGNPSHARFLAPDNPEWRPNEQNPGAIRSPSFLYNGTIHPLQPFAIRGVVWYQGESDAQWPDLYPGLFRDVVGSWRKAWGHDFPFLFVQLAPYDDVKWDRLGEAWAWQREAQTQSLEIPGTRMAVITDGGEAEDIHPQAKNLPGERLALLAAQLDNPGVVADSPVFKSMEIGKGAVRLVFDHAGKGLETRRVALNTAKGFLPGEGPSPSVAEANELKGFMVCGSDRRFVEAQARIVGADTVAVSSPAVKEPVAVRYGWANFPLCNLYNSAGLPAVPFRTDRFPMPDFRKESVQP